MEINDVCIDTNVYSAFLKAIPEVVRIVGRAKAVWLSAVVLGELRAGFLNGKLQAQNELMLRDFLSSPTVHVIPVDETVASRYSEVWLQLKKAGRPIPTNDVWIAASALALGFPLYSLDKHFQNVEGLKLV